MLSNTMQKMLAKIEKREKLEESKKQFSQIPQSERIAYVWTGSTSFPMPLAKAK